ncbi:MAG TPA: DUF1573 domain-containing protein [Gemmataceae bacterium]|nr:DUF1573 domain-containing protein [Gemmataceae bacterium]
MKRKLLARSMPWWAGFLAVVLLAPDGTAGRADLHFPEPTVDVGEVRCGAPLSHRFTFINRGPVPVEILEVRAGCGCLTPRLPQRLWQPGEAGSLLLEVNTLSEEEGPHAWTCQVICQGAGRRFEVPLQIIGRVIAEVTVRPAVLTVFSDSSVGHELVLTDRRPRPLTITELRSTSPRLVPRLTEQTQDDRGHWVRRIRLEVSADYPEGRHEETLNIFTDDPLYRDLKVPVTVVKRSRPRVTAVPAAVELTAAVPSCRVRLRDSQNQAVVVERITADDPAIACQWAPGPDTEATLKVRVDCARLSGGNLRSAIRVHLSRPVRETVVIPVRVDNQARRGL